MRKYLVLLFVLGCDMGGEWKHYPPRHSRSKVEAYCSTPKLLDHGYFGSGMHPCSNRLGSQVTCERKHYEECLSVYR